ncbi:helix-turn-helix domain-containing protein [Arthrobacter sp. ISL-5]|uniref:winged helix-turn-helix domain-containing protein n=1 Tax=Arthrobacter sp. ISL-5 TaxID=2819111 RepID=UPI001BEC7F9E|nr:helix-turn-helix domain-containing protein [Arthrobacter sp. ISL-5]MBT2554940.1 helix-turn-helix transcriptional regulator [Arthrobacter sp. ISL-5]
MSNILMNRTRSQIIRFLLKNGPSTCGQIGVELQTSPSSIRRQLNVLRETGLVRRTSTQFVASPEQVQRQIDALAASFDGAGHAVGSRESHELKPDSDVLRATTQRRKDRRKA